MSLCYATVFKTIQEFVQQKNPVNVTCKALWNSMFNGEIDIDEDENKYQYHSKTELPNRVKTKALSRRICEISQSINQFLTPLINVEKQKKVINIINCLIKVDKNISDDDIICNDPAFTKKEFLKKTAWEFEIYLAIILKYIFSDDNEIKGENAQKILKQIKNEFDLDDNINIIQFNNSIVLPIKVNTSHKKFKETFFELSHSFSLNLSRNNHIKLFTLDILNNKFEYTNIKLLYKLFLTDYIISNNMQLSYNEIDEIRLMFYDAMMETKKIKNYKYHALGNLLLFTFLEHVLEAPKLFNSITLSKNNSFSQAVHILNVNGLNTQLIFGTAEIINDLNSAINNAFNQILKIETNLSEEKNIIINSQNLNYEFDAKTAEIIKNIIIPRENHDLRPENAFSILIGYSLCGVDKSLNINEYKIALHEKLLKDIHNSTQTINDKINSLNLNGYSFYIYFIPFNNAELDKLSIVEV